MKGQDPERLTQLEAVEKEALAEKSPMATTLYKYYLKMKEQLSKSQTELTELESNVLHIQQQIAHDQGQLDEAVKILQQMYQVDVDTIRIVKKL